MKLYTKPELNVEKFDVEDIITATTSTIVDMEKDQGEFDVESAGMEFDINVNGNEF